MILFEPLFDGRDSKFELPAIIPLHRTSSDSLGQASDLHPTKDSMRLHSVLSIVSLVSITALRALAADPKGEAIPAIRDFDVATLSRLGREIYQQDQLAWKATDIVMELVGMARLQKDGVRGWIVDTSDLSTPFVRWLRSGEHGLEVQCDVLFPVGGKPDLRVPQDRTLPPKQLAQAVALETAKARFLEAQLPWCGGNPNTAVLDDPDGSGFLVYLLRPKPATDQVPVGGHYRFTVSADGKTVEQIDRLFASCLTIAKQTPEGAEPVALFLTHIVSPTPLETHIFLSLQEGVSFAVSTNDGTLWMIEKGEIRNAGKIDDLKKQLESKPKKSGKKAK